MMVEDDIYKYFIIKNIIIIMQSTTRRSQLTKIGLGIIFIN